MTKGLTPAMRETLGTSAEPTVRYPGARVALSGLYASATLNALVRRGLAVREYDAARGAYEFYLTEAGFAARAELRARVDEELIERGFSPTSDGRYASLEGAYSRGAAMRLAGVSY